MSGECSLRWFSSHTRSPCLSHSSRSAGVGGLCAVRTGVGAHLLEAPHAVRLQSVGDGDADARKVLVVGELHLCRHAVQKRSRGVPGDRADAERRRCARRSRAASGRSPRCSTSTATATRPSELRAAARTIVAFTVRFAASSGNAEGHRRPDDGAVGAADCRAHVEAVHVDVVVDDRRRRVNDGVGACTEASGADVGSAGLTRRSPHGATCTGSAVDSHTWRRCRRRRTTSHRAASRRRSREDVGAAEVGGRSVDREAEGGVAAQVAAHGACR